MTFFLKKFMYVSIPIIYLVLLLMVKKGKRKERDTAVLKNIIFLFIFYL